MTEVPGKIKSFRAGNVRNRLDHLRIAAGVGILTFALLKLAMYYSHESTLVDVTEEAAVPGTDSGCKALNNKQCGWFRYDDEDIITASHSKPEIFTLHDDPLIGQLLHNVAYYPDSEDLEVTQTCDKQLGRPGGFQINFGAIRYSETLNIKEAQRQCRFLPGTWFFLSNRRDNSKNNLFDQISTDLYHIHLMKRSLCPNGSKQTVYITHVRSDRNASTIAFPDIVDYLGNYVAWADIVNQATGCVMFERVVTTSAGWLWMDKALPSYINTPLVDFARGLTQHVGATSVQPDPCKPKIVITQKRADGIEDPRFPNRDARGIRNYDEMIQATLDALPDYEVIEANLGSLPFNLQVALIKSAHIFVFPHGGSGPHVLWMTPGAVAVELFCFGSSDPMYRNMAVQTGKTYMGWQAQHFAEKMDADELAIVKKQYHFKPKSHFYVDIDEYTKLIKMAAAVARGGVGESWMPTVESSRKHFVTELTPWSTDHHDGCFGGKGHRDPLKEVEKEIFNSV